MHNLHLPRFVVQRAVQQTAQRIYNKWIVLTRSGVVQFVVRLVVQQLNDKSLKRWSWERRLFCVHSLYIHS